MIGNTLNLASEDIEKCVIDLSYNVPSSGQEYYYNKLYVNGLSKNLTQYSCYILQLTSQSSFLDTATSVNETKFEWSRMFVVGFIFTDVVSALLTQSINFSSFNRSLVNTIFPTSGSNFIHSDGSIHNEYSGFDFGFIFVNSAGYHHCKNLQYILYCW